LIVEVAESDSCDEILERVDVRIVCCGNILIEEILSGVVQFVLNKYDDDTGVINDDLSQVQENDEVHD
jgi:hypothetical protein